jgi:hypothetical protein
MPHGARIVSQAHMPGAAFPNEAPGSFPQPPGRSTSEAIRSGSIVRIQSRVVRGGSFSTPAIPSSPFPNAPPPTSYGSTTTRLSASSVWMMASAGQAVRVGLSMKPGSLPSRTDVSGVSLPYVTARAGERIRYFFAGDGWPGTAALAPDSTYTPRTTGIGKRAQRGERL